MTVSMPPSARGFSALRLPFVILAVAIAVGAPLSAQDNVRQT